MFLFWNDELKIMEQQESPLPFEEPVTINAITKLGLYYSW